MPEHAKPLDIVVSLDYLAGAGIERGQVGKVVERLDRGRVLVAFSDNKGNEQAVLPIGRSRLWVLHTNPLIPELDR